MSVSFFGSVFSDFASSASAFSTGVSSAGASGAGSSAFGSSTELLPLESLLQEFPQQVLLLSVPLQELPL